MLTPRDRAFWSLIAGGPSPVALAFTLGDEIHFAPGLYDPASRQGVELLGHELTHVVQQRDGRVANPHGQGVAIVQDPALEVEADRMGQRIAEELWSRTGAGRAGQATQTGTRRGGSALMRKVVILAKYGYEPPANLTNLLKETGVSRMYGKPLQGVRAQVSYVVASGDITQIGPYDSGSDSY